MNRLTQNSAACEGSEELSLHQSTEKHRKQCSELERELGKLRAMLKAKNQEIERLKQRNCAEGTNHTKANSQTLRSVQDLRTYEAFLMQENALLRRSVPSPSEIPRLQQELEEALRLQRFYKKKLQNLQDKSLTKSEPLAKDTSSATASDKAAAQKPVSRLNVQALLARQKDLRAQVESIREEIKETEEERDYFRETVVPVLRKTVELFGQYKKTLLSEIEEAERKREYSPQKTQMVSVLPPIAPISPRIPSRSMISPRVSSSMNSKSSSLTGANGTLPYTPSYLRLKRRALKVKIRRETASAGTIQEVEDEFANSFPEEDELELRMD